MPAQPLNPPPAPLYPVFLSNNINSSNNNDNNSIINNKNASDNGSNDNSRRNNYVNTTIGNANLEMNIALRAENGNRSKSGCDNINDNLQNQSNDVLGRTNGTGCAKSNVNQNNNYSNDYSINYSNNYGNGLGIGESAALSFTESVAITDLEEDIGFEGNGGVSVERNVNSYLIVIDKRPDGLIANFGSAKKVNS